MFVVKGPNGEDLIKVELRVTGSVPNRIASDLMRRGFDEKQLRAIAGLLSPLINRKVENAKTGKEKQGHQPERRDSDKGRELLNWVYRFHSWKAGTASTMFFQARGWSPKLTQLFNG